MGQSAADGATPSVRFAPARGAAVLVVLAFALAVVGCGETTDAPPTASRQAGQTTKAPAPGKRAESQPASTAVSEPARSLDAEAARAAVRRLPGVRAVVWRDHDRLLVMVGGQRYRSADTVDRICRSLEALGDARAVMVDVQDITARNSEEAVAISRGCAPAESGPATE